MTDPQVPKHFIIAPWIATASDVNSGLGQVGAAYSVVYGNLEDAKAQARAQAAQQPGNVWVVYAALWYAYTDETPVNLRHVVGANL